MKSSMETLEIVLADMEDDFQKLLRNVGEKAFTAAAAKALIIRHAAVYNVLDYEAKGDGVTDDTAAIQRALDAARLISPQPIVFFPPGYYPCEDITIYDGTRIKADRNAYLMPLTGTNFILHTGATSQVTNIRIEGLGFYNDDVSIPMKCIKIAPSAPGFANQGIYLQKIRIERNVYQGIDLTGQQFGQCYLSEILMRRLNPVAPIAGVAQPRDSGSFGIKGSGLIVANDIEIIGSFHKGFWGYNAFVKLDGYNIAGSGNLAGADDYWIENGVYLDGSSGIVTNGYHEKQYVTGLRPIDEQAIRLVNGSKRVLVDSVDVEEGSLIVEDGCFDVEVRRAYFLKGTILNYNKNQNVRYSSCNNDLLNNPNPFYSPFVYSVTDISPCVDVGRSGEIVTDGIGFFGGGYPFTVSVSTDATPSEETGSGYFALGDRSLKLVTTSASKYIVLSFYGVVPNQPYVFSGLAMANTSAKVGNINNTSVNGNGVYGALIDLTSDFVAGQKWRPIVAALVSTTNVLDVKITLTDAGTMYLCAGLLSKGKYNYPNLTN